MLFDRTCAHTRRLPVGLSHAWRVGGRIYQLRNHLDACHGVDNWADGLSWLSGFDRIDEIQIWAHGHWGSAQMACDVLDRRALQEGHPLHPLLCRVRERMAPNALWWFRTCDTFGSDRGHRFAQEFSDFLQRSVAGHTHIIGIVQSGLHRIEPGQAPHWPADEGVSEGSAAHPKRSTWSTPSCPNSIHMMRSTIPEGW